MRSRELAMKATPLLLIALGLAVCFRSNVWNIGAEGQFVVGAIAASGIAMLATKDSGSWFFLPVLVGGVLGGMLWAAIVALLRDRFNANEILVSLMLVYVAGQLLNYLVYGPWKDPHGYNFPQTITFYKSTQVPRLFGSFRVNLGAIAALLAVGAFWLLLFRTYAGFQLQVGGLAPAAARYAGFSSRKALWTALLLSGGMAGLAGGLEVAGPARPAHAARAGGLRLRRDHRRLRRPPPSAGHRLLGDPDEHVLHRRRAGAVAARPAEVAHRRVPGPAAVHPARLRHPDRLPGALEAGREGSTRMMDSWPLLVAATLNSGTVLAFAALGLLINERAGIVNLGAEGIMLVAAVAGFATVVHTGNDWLGFGAGALAGMAMAAAFGVLVIWLNTNQYASGLALSLFGVGFSAFVGIRYTQEKLGERPNFEIPGLAELPFIGPALFRQHPMVYVAIALTVAIAWFLYRSRSGLVLRAVGESPESAHALGYPVRRIRFAAVLVGGALCGISGAYISTVYTPLWVEGMIAGKGWIALALTTFATWRPARVLLGAYLFGGVTMLQFHLQGEGVQVPSQFLTMLPYLATIVVLVLISRNASFIRVNMPASIGKPFFPG